MADLNELQPKRFTTSWRREEDIVCTIFVPENKKRDNHGGTTTGEAPLAFTLLASYLVLVNYAN